MKHALGYYHARMHTHNIWNCSSISGSITTQHRTVEYLPFYMANILFVALNSLNVKGNQETQETTMP